jgi:hypothetical protein
MAFCLSPMAAHDFKTSPARIWGERYAKCHYSKDLHCQWEAKKSRWNQ